MNHHVRWSVAALVVVGVGVGAARQLNLFAGTDSTAVPAGQAKQRYDASTSSGTTGATAASDTSAASTDTSARTTAGPATTTTIAVLPPGVYVYTTTGHDSVDALNGAHPYAIHLTSLNPLA